MQLRYQGDNRGFFRLRIEVWQLHRQRLFKAITILMQESLVQRQQLHAISRVDQHRHRIALEQQPKTRFALTQALFALFLVFKNTQQGQTGSLGAFD